ncbi:polymorphic toxin-type HINT domain-containing protein [Streptomyces sp. NBC_00669]|uniref:polymorphic toxin-type HINT domain-containing protein n=1 Tax=Streptomyces sp. NBC_00669 TaxID=2976011 RepID=UPI002E318218|nr:polymorphic toxin-type HINT domain-containing protein [Streptomyces sp. NBC_00669]
MSVASRVAAQAAGVSGALMKVTRPRAATGLDQARVSLDYSGFAHAYGGDFGARLTLVALPACSLTTPDQAQCRTRTPLTGVDNDVTAKTLSATLPAETSATAATTMVVAADSTAKSGAGSYQATSLSPSATWNAGNSSGDFTWSYPITTPPPASGPTPDLAISYDAQSVDGRLPSTNNQPSWVGEGFDLGTSYVERSYDSCDEDGTNASGKYDQCWAGNNINLVLNGKATPLLWNADTKTWHPKEDDGERVVRCWNPYSGQTDDDTNACPGTTNGDDNGEYWKVTTTDGTQYVFGMDRLPGWASGKPTTNSTLTVPVFGDDSGEPCHAGTFADSACTQAWRWNLSYVVDTHHDAMSYWYTKETNSYGKNGNTTTAGTSYDRGSYLSRIDYGETDSTFFGTPADQVKFTTAERCLPVKDGETCATLNAAAAKDWPDVPFDQICAANAVCKTTSPSFFTRKRLTGITTDVWDALATTPDYRKVDSWALDQSFPDPGDGTSAGLWLKSITRTGEDGGEQPMPPVTFAGKQLTNRVDTTHDDIAALIKWRVRTITSETGSVITANYSDEFPDTATQCLAGSHMPSAADSNTMLCYPVTWAPPFEDKQTDWFQKYVVKTVIVSDPSGGSANMETDYSYQNPAWHYDTDDVISPAKDVSWSQWRGYGLVTTTTGDSQTTRTKTVTTYYQGMDGDKKSAGGTRSATVVDSNGTHVTDADQLAGQVRETRTFNGADEVSSTITDQWTSNTATDGSRKAFIVRPTTVTTRTDRASGAPRTSTVTTTYDSATGADTSIDDHGDDAVTGDEQCTTTKYSDNTSVWIRNLPIDVRTVDVPCGTTPKVPDDIVSETRSLYDDLPYGSAPTLGNETSTQRLSSYNGDTPVFQTIATNTYDGQGRLLTATDADQHTATTTYTPTTGGPVTSVVTKNSKQFSNTTTYDPARNVETASVDPNGKRTDFSYDPLGRLTGVWLPTRSKANKQNANTTYDYVFDPQRVAAPYVRTGLLRNDGTSYTYSFDIYDSLLRARQTQDPTPGGGRVFTDTTYDSRGLAVVSDSDYSNTDAPSGALQSINDVYPAQTVTTYDGAARPTVAAFYADNTYRWSTTTVYGGDITTVIPPTGGIATATVTDTLGRTVETRQYDSATGTGPYTSIKYTYNPKGQMTDVVDAGNNEWSYKYDLMGRKTTTTDPDAGTSHTLYTDLDQVLSTTDSRGKTTSYTYDELGRTTAEYDAAADQQAPANQIAKWTYDTVAKGLPTASTRYVSGSGTGGLAYTSQVGTYDALYNPLRSRVVIPSAPGEQALAGSYEIDASYNLDGTLESTTDPAAGGLDQESLLYGYNSLLMPTSLQGDYHYINGTNYTDIGQVKQLTMLTAKQVQETNTYEDGTGRLLHQLVSDDTGSGIVQDSHYTYDNAGNPTLVDTRADSVDDTQCYQYDGHDRLTEAFTTAATWQTANACGTAPTSTTLGNGPAPYWQSYTYDALGNRKKLVEHAAAAGSTDTTTDYGYGSPTDSPHASQPHTLTTSTTTTATSTTTNSYVYDAAGNTQSRDLNGTTENLIWNDQGQLDSEQAADGTGESYIYDTDGNRILSRDSTGTTLYLGDTEVHLDKDTTHTTATRYYSWLGQNIAVRSSDGSFQWVLTDAHNTATAQIDATTQAVTYRRSDPFGNERGTAPTAWTGDHGFVGGVESDTTGLTHLGARDYDPTIGRFVSLDPVLELTDPQQVNGYSYAAGNPITGADPDGLMLETSRLYGGACDQYCIADQEQTNYCAKYNSGIYCENGKPTPQSILSDKHLQKTDGLSKWLDLFSSSAGKSIMGGIEDGANTVWDGAKCAIAANCADAVQDAKDTVSGWAHTITNLKEAYREARQGHSAQVLGTLAGTLIAAWLSKKAMPDLGIGKKKPGRCSFSPDTQVLMDGGKTKPIGEIKPGDEVEAADPGTGKHQKTEKVTATWINHDDDLVDLTIDTGSGHASVLHTTSKHPFWDDTLHKWLPAAQLTPGHALETATNTHVRLAGKTTRPGTADMYNLTVNELHTYYVLVGGASVLVHNCDAAEELAALPEYSGGHTTGSAVASDGRRYDLTSGLNRGEDSDLVSWVNGRLKKIGATNANSGRAMDVEQKFAAVMDRDGIANANLYINHPGGPCTVKLGCDSMLPVLLGPNRSLTVHWPGGSKTYEGVG